MKPEAIFQNELIRIAPLYRCLFLTIPDFIPIKGNKIIAHKRPCDGILATWRQNYLIECKYGNSPLRPHQKKYMQEVNTINNSYFVIRKKILKKGIIYIVEQNYPYSTFPILSCLFKTEKIEELFKFFTMPEEYKSQDIMLNTLFPEKKKPKLRKIYL